MCMKATDPEWGIETQERLATVIQFRGMKATDPEWGIETLLNECKSNFLIISMKATDPEWGG